MVVNHGQIGDNWAKNHVKTRIFDFESPVSDSVKSGDFKELSWFQKCPFKRVLQSVFLLKTALKQWWNT